MTAGSNPVLTTKNKLWEIFGIGLLDYQNVLKEVDVIKTESIIILMKSKRQGILQLFLGISIIVQNVIKIHRNMVKYSQVAER